MSNKVFFKSFISIFIFLSVILSFNSCKNFLNGSQFMEDLTKKMDYEKSKSLVVRIDTSLESGDITPKGNINLKKTDVQEIQFTPSADFQFIKFVAVDKDTDEDYSEYVKFSNVTESKNDSKPVYKVKAEIVNEKDNILIKPICVATPKIVNKTPSYDENGKPKNSPIIVEFKTPANCKISENSFRYTAEEIAQLKEDENITDSNFLFDENSNAYGYKKEGITYIKGISILSDGISFAEYYSVPNLKDNVLTIAQNIDKPITVKDSGLLDVYVTVSPSVYFDYEYNDDGVKNTKQIYLGENNNEWHYKLSNKTLEQTKVTISTNNLGAMLKGQSGTYNLGDVFEVEFKPNDEYQFKEWSYNKSIIELCKSTVNEEKGSIITEFKTISPTIEGQEAAVVVDCIKRAIIESKTPEFENGAKHPYDTAISIEFDKSMDLRCFIFSEGELKELLGENIQDTDYIKDNNDNIVAYWKEGLKYFKNISITDEDKKENLEKNFIYPVFSADGKSIVIEPDVSSDNKMDFSLSPTKEITVCINGSVFDTEGATLGKDFKWNYFADKSTTKKAKINFNYFADCAIVNYKTGINQFNIGEEFTITYAPKKGYSFSDWHFNFPPEWKINPDGLHTGNDIWQHHEQKDEEGNTKLNEYGIPLYEDTIFGYYVYEGSVVEIYYVYGGLCFKDSKGFIHDFIEATFVPCLQVKNTSFDKVNQTYETEVKIINECEIGFISESYLIPTIDKVTVKTDERNQISKYDGIEITFNKPMPDDIGSKLCISGSSSASSNDSPIWYGDMYYSGDKNMSSSTCNPQVILSENKKVVTVYFDFSYAISSFGLPKLESLYINLSTDFEDRETGIRCEDMLNRYTDCSNWFTDTTNSYTDCTNIDRKTDDPMINTITDDNKKIYVGKFTFDLTAKENNKPILLYDDVYIVNKNGIELSKSSYDEWTESQAQNNHLKDSVHINSLKASDNGSGIQKLIISETLYKNVDGTAPVNPITYTKEYKNFKRDVFVYSLPEFDYYFQTEKDGVLKLDFQVCDKDGNKSENILTYYVIKDTVLDLADCGFYIKIEKNNNSNKLICNLCNGSETYQIGKDGKAFKTIYNLTQNITCEPFTFYFEYGTDKNNLTKTKEFGSYITRYIKYCEVADIPIPLTDGLIKDDYYIKVTVCDAVGNEDYDELIIPKTPTDIKLLNKVVGNYCVYYFNNTDFEIPDTSKLSRFELKPKFSGAYTSEDGKVQSIPNYSEDTGGCRFYKTHVPTDYRIYCTLTYNYISKKENRTQLEISFPELLVYDTTEDNLQLTAPEFEITNIRKGEINSSKVAATLTITDNFDPDADYYFASSDYNYSKINLDENHSAEVQINFGSDNCYLSAQKNNSSISSKKYISNSPYTSVVDTVPPVIDCGLQDYKYSLDGKNILIQKSYFTDSSAGLKTEDNGNIKAEVKYVYQKDVPTFYSTDLILNKISLSIDRTDYQKVTAKSLTINGTDYYEIPLMDLSKADGNLFLYIKIFDKNDNYCEKLISSFIKVEDLKINSTVNIESTTGTSNTISLNIESKENGSTYYGSYYIYDSGLQTWSLIEQNKEFTDLKAIFENTVVSNTFVKAVVSCEEIDGIYYHYYYKPYYSTYKYIGGNYCSLKNIYESKDAITVFSDNSVLVYTISSPDNYGNDIIKWEANGSHLNFQQLEFSETKTMMNYNQSLKEITDGEYYMPVFIFADGTIMTGEIKQKI